MNGFFLVQQNFCKTIPSSWKNNYPWQVSSYYGSLLRSQLYHLLWKRRGDADLDIRSSHSSCSWGEMSSTNFSGLVAVFKLKMGTLQALCEALGSSWVFKSCALHFARRPLDKSTCAWDPFLEVFALVLLFQVMFICLWWSTSGTWGQWVLNPLEQQSPNREPWGELHLR